MLLDNEMLDSSMLIKGLMNNIISLPAATEELIWGNRDCVLGSVVHDIGMSMLIRAGVEMLTWRENSVREISPGLERWTEQALPLNNSLFDAVWLNISAGQ